MAHLTPKRFAILKFIADRLRSEECAPTLAEIGTHVGLASLASVHKHIESLKANGYLEPSTTGRRRSICLTEQGRRSTNKITGDMGHQYHEALQRIGNALGMHPGTSMINGAPETLIERMWVTLSSEIYVPFTRDMKVCKLCGMYGPKDSAIEHKPSCVMARRGNLK